MGKGLFTIIALSLSTIIIYGEVRISSYFCCCCDCQNEEITYIIKHQCCKIHCYSHWNGLLQHDDQTDKEYRVSCEQTHETCGFQHSLMNWILSVQNNNQIQPQIISLGEFRPHSYSNKRTYFPLGEAKILKDISCKPPNLSKEIYFSLLSLLTI